MKEIIQSVRKEIEALCVKVQSNTATEAEGIRLAILTEFCKNLASANQTWPGVLLPH